MIADVFDPCEPTPGPSWETRLMIRLGVVVVLGYLAWLATGWM